MLLDAGFDELAEDIKNGETKIPVGKKGDWELLFATIEFRKLDKSTDWEAVAAQEGTRRGRTTNEVRNSTMDEIAIKHDVLPIKLRSFMEQEGGHYRRLKEHLPEDLFPKIKRK